MAKQNKLNKPTIKSINNLKDKVISIQDRPTVYKPVSNAYKTPKKLNKLLIIILGIILSILITLVLNF